MGRTVHAEGLRERRNMKQADTGRSLIGTTFRYECRICGADHGTERHSDCPECGLNPMLFNPRIQDHVTWEEKRKLPVRTNTGWASKRMEVVEE